MATRRYVSGARRMKVGELGRLEIRAARRKTKVGLERGDYDREATAASRLAVEDGKIGRLLRRETGSGSNAVQSKNQ